MQHKKLIFLFQNTECPYYSFEPDPQTWRNILKHNCCYQLHLSFMIREQPPIQFTLYLLSVCVCDVYPPPWPGPSAHVSSVSPAWPSGVRVGHGDKINVLLWLPENGGCKDSQKWKCQVNWSCKTFVHCKIDINFAKNASVFSNNCLYLSKATKIENDVIKTDWLCLSSSHPANIYVFSLSSVFYCPLGWPRWIRTFSQQCIPSFKAVNTLN